jgi:hypothetical protein
MKTLKLLLAVLPLVSACQSNQDLYVKPYSHMDDLTLLMEVSRKVIVPDAYDTFRSDEEALADQGIEFEEVANHFSGCATRYTKEHADRRDLEVLYELHLTPKSEKHLLAQRISKPEIEKALEVYLVASLHEYCYANTLDWIEKKAK